MIKQIKLLPCKSCGYVVTKVSDVVYWNRNYSIGKFFCLCPECGTKTRVFDDMNEAIKEWNLRTLDIVTCDECRYHDDCDKKIYREAGITVNKYEPINYCSAGERG